MCCSVTPYQHKSDAHMYPPRLNSLLRMLLARGLFHIFDPYLYIQGLLDVGAPKAGEALVVTGAAGATGSIACQIGKLKGLKVIAIAGTDDKCAWLEKELGVDRAINYKSENFARELKESLGHLDVMFDNVGGNILNLCLKILNTGARIVVCGLCFYFLLLSLTIGSERS